MKVTLFINKDLLQKHHDTVSDLYSKVDLKKFGNNPIEAPNTTELLQKFASEESNADKFSKAGSEKSYYSEMLDNLKPKTVTKTSPIVDEFGGKITKTETIPSQIDPEAAKAWIKRINKQLSPAYRRNNPVMTGDPSKLKAIKNSLNQEFKDYIRPIDPQMASNLDKADKVYGESIQNLNDGIFKKVHDMKDTPDHLFDFLTSSGVSAPDLQKATSILDPSQLKEFQTSAFKKIITAAKTKTGNGFAPSSIEGQLKSLGEERVSAMLNPKQVQLLKDLDDLAKSMKGFTKISEGSPTAHLGKLSAIISSLGTGAFAPSILPGIITAISGMVAGDKAMSSMMRSKWLNNAAKGKSIPKKSVTVLSVNPSTALNATASANRIFGQDQNGGGNG